jgi:Tol biopolymer transport system component
MKGSPKVVLSALLLSAPAFPDAAWDIEATGQPYRDVSLAVTEGTWMSLDVSPDGRTILFDLLGDIYSLAAAGGEARLVHGGAAMQRDPRFSPDGSRIAFISDRSGSDNVWISAPDGSGARQITGETTNVLTGPSWTSDGTGIAAALLPDMDLKMHNSELRMFELSGGAGRLLVPQPRVGENVHEAQFSPDGRYLYYTEKVTPPSTAVVYIDANHSQYAIQRRDLETGETVELVRGFGGATTPRPSRDGEKIAFVRRVKAKTVLFVYDVGTGGQRPVFDGLDRDATADFLWQGSYYPQYGWFPDHRHLAIWAQGKLWKVDTESGVRAEIPFRVAMHHRVTRPSRFENDLAPDDFEVRAIRQLAHSPSRDVVVFNALGRLWRKSGDSPPVRLSDATALEFEPAFSPDGKTIAYVEWTDEGGGTLKLIGVDGRRARTLLESGAVLREPAFSPDGKLLMYSFFAGDRCLGGHEATAPGTYVMDIATRERRLIGPPMDAPMFSPDGRRIYYTSAKDDGTALVTSLESVDLSGRDHRTHARTRDADTSELRISPDLRWIAFRDRNQYYVARYSETGRPVLVVARESAIPVFPLSEIGGYGLEWSADSKAIHWVVGPTLETVTVDASALSVGEVHRERIGFRAPADKPSGTIAFTNARIITMADDQVIERGAIVVRGNRIVAVGAMGEVRVPDDAVVHDAAGKTIMPGLIDMHGHINKCYYTSSGLMPQKQAPRYASLAFGITTNYDPYTSELDSYAQAEMTLSGDMVGPRAIESGFIAFGQPGKIDFTYVPIRDPDDARAFMARKKALGGLIIKNYRQPMRSQRQMLFKAGRDAGLMVDVEGGSHFYNNVTHILDGPTNLQHNIPLANLYDDVVQLMKVADVHHTPTIVAVFGELFGESYIYQNERVWEDERVQKYVPVVTSGYNPVGTPHFAPPHVRGMATIRAADEIWDIGFRSVARSIKKLDDAGVTISAGSHGEFAGLALHWELQLLSEGGMAPMRLLRTATINGARTLGLDRQIGSLEPGKLADLIVLDRNPLTDIRNTRTARHAMVNGRLYDTLTMNEIGDRERARGRFYWEVGRARDLADWKKPWAHQ